jgi:hypothetical protein
MAARSKSNAAALGNVLLIVQIMAAGPASGVCCECFSLFVLSLIGLVSKGRLAAPTAG